MSDQNILTELTRCISCSSLVEQPVLMMKMCKKDRKYQKLWTKKMIVIDREN